MYFLIIAFFIILLTYLFYRLNYTEIYRYLHLKGCQHIEFYDKMYSKIPRVKSKRKVVISLTTIPSRIDKIKPTLISLMDSSRRVDEIQINIPYKTLKGYKYTIPKWLFKLKNVKIYRVEKDYGPGTKLIPTLKRENKDTVIIVVDDDVIYGSRLIETYLNVFHEKHCALTTYGAFVTKNLSLKCENLPTFFRFRKAQYVDLVMGHNSFLVTPNMFSEDVFDYSDAPEEAKFVDDVWFSGWLNYNKIKIWSLGNCDRTTPITNFETVLNSESLCFGENCSSHNNDKVIRWFFKNKFVKYLCHKY